MDEHHYDREGEEIERLKRIEKKEDRELALLELIESQLKPRPTFIKIQFGGTMPGPVTLNVGQKTVASVAVFDQNGNDMTAKFDFTANPVTWTLDSTTLDSGSATAPDPANADTITSLAAGTANLTANVPNVANPTDTEQIINLQPSIPTSVKINFSTPA